MNSRQRIVKQIAGEEIYRPPALGGWNLGVRNLAELAGLGVEEYLRNPMAGVVRANHALGVDGMVPPIVPTDLDSIRAGKLEEKDFAGIEPEALLRRARAIPDSEAA